MEESKTNLGEPKIQQPVENTNIEDGSDVEWKIYLKRPTALQSQKRKFLCIQCSSEYGCSCGLAQHIQIKNEGMRVICYQCDHQYTTLGDLNKHKQYKHEGVWYECY